MEQQQAPSPSEGCVGQNLADFLGTPYSEAHHIEVPGLDMSHVEKELAEGQDAVTTADYVWARGGALEYMETVAHLMHVGDDTIIRGLLLSFANTYLARYSGCTGTNIEVTGSSGSGKSDVIKTALALIPPAHMLNSKLSDKALYYAQDKIHEGMVITFDDQSLSEDMQGTLKSLTWDEPYKMITVKNQQPLELLIPPRCPVWADKVEGVGDEQIENRCLTYWVDESEGHKAQVRQQRAERRMSPTVARDEYMREVTVCRLLWDRMPKDVFVAVPYADRIAGGGGDNRTENMLYNQIMASCIMHAAQRVRNERGELMATEEDFAVAASVINPLMRNEEGSQFHKLKLSQKRVLEYLSTVPSGTYDYGEILHETKLCASTLTYAITGRKADGTDGLLALCPAIHRVYLSKKSWTGNDSETVSRYAIDWNLEAYQTWYNGDISFYLG